MKNKVLIVLILLFTLCASGYSLPEGLGIKGGLVGSGLITRSTEYEYFLGYEVDWLQDLGGAPIFGFSIGVFKTFPISARFRFQPEINLIEKGLDFSHSFIYGKITHRVKIAYLELPLPVMMQLSRKGRLNPGIYFGPYLAIKLLAKKTIATGDQREVTDMDNVKTLDYGILMGVYLDYKLKPGTLILDFRISLGLQNSMHPVAGSVRLHDNDSIRNVSAIVALGYRF